MKDKSKSTFRAVALLVALISAALGVTLELYPGQFSGLGMSILSGMCFIAVGISFIGD